MTILEYKRYFKNELLEIYSESESDQLYSIFLHKIVGFDRFQERRFMNEELLKTDEEKLQDALMELKTGKPYQHILGEAEFYGRKFFVNENVLIPRPETEELLEFAIHKISSLKYQTSNLKFLDIGTGSGIIPITLKKHFPEAEIYAIDVSGKALAIAKKNAELHQVEINFIHKDFLNSELDETFDVIISNPPYIGIDEEVEISSSVKDFEPKIALFAPTSDALIFYRKIAKDSENFLSENGIVFLEINQKLGKETLELFKNFSDAELIKDLSENDRFIFAKK